METYRSYTYKVAESGEAELRLPSGAWRSPTALRVRPIVTYRGQVHEFRAVRKPAPAEPRRYRCSAARAPLPGDVAQAGIDLAGARRASRGSLFPVKRR